MNPENEIPNSEDDDCQAIYDGLDRLVADARRDSQGFNNGDEEGLSHSCRKPLTSEEIEDLLDNQPQDDK